MSREGGRTVAHPISHRLLTAEVNDLYMGFVVGKVRLGEVSLLIFRFSPVNYPSTISPYSYIYRSAHGQWARYRLQFY